jgi:hypothetical protein
MSTPTDMPSLFQAAQSGGALSTASMQALTIADIGAMIQAGLGTPVEDMTASEAVSLLTPGSDVSQIRRASQIFSQSAVHASQSATHLSQAVLGGLGRRSVEARG